MGLLSSGAPAPSLRALWGGGGEPGVPGTGVAGVQCSRHARARQSGASSGPGAGWGARVQRAPLQPRQVQAGLRPLSPGLADLLSPPTSSLEGPAKRQPQGFQPRTSGAHLAKYWLPGGSSASLGLVLIETRPPRTLPHGLVPAPLGAKCRRAFRSPGPQLGRTGLRSRTWGWHEAPGQTLLPPRRSPGACSPPALAPRGLHTI